MNTSNLRTKSLAIAAILVVVLIAIVSVGGQFFYVLKTVEQQEVGVQFREGRITDVVGPGVYSDFGLFVSMVNNFRAGSTFRGYRPRNHYQGQTAYRTRGQCGHLPSRTSTV